MGLLTQSYVAGSLCAVLKSIWLVLCAMALYDKVTVADAIELDKEKILSLVFSVATLITLIIQVLLSLVILVRLFNKRTDYRLVILGVFSVGYALEWLVVISRMLYLRIHFGSTNIIDKVGILFLYITAQLVTFLFIWILGKYYFRTRPSNDSENDITEQPANSET